MRRCVTIALLVCLVSHLSAQTLHLYADTLRANDLVSRLSDDQLLLYLVGRQGQRLAAREDSILNVQLESDTTTVFPFHIGLRDSLRIAHYVQTKSEANPLFMPIYYVPLKRSSLMDTDDKGLTAGMQLQRDMRRHIAVQHPELCEGVYNPDVVREISPEIARLHTTPFIPVKALVRDVEEDRLDRLRAIRQKYTYWYKEATVMVQLSQNYVSKNWYAGGNTNFALLGILQGKIIYNNRKNITWENTGEWRFGFNTVSGDSLRKVNTNEDMFRLYSKFGIKIVDKLNGSVSAEFQTNFFNTWKENTKQLKTGTLTPARFNFAAGLDYRPVRGLSLFFAPLTYKMVAAADTTHVKQTTFGIAEGQKVMNDVGSSLRVDWLWKPVREIALESKFYLYTNYSRVEIDWEVTADFIINRFLSARVLLHPRYDNTVILPQDEKAKMQFKELISVGFSHKFH